MRGKMNDKKTNHLKMRRKDRQITDEKWMENLISAASIGFVSIAGEEYPLIHINTFVYDKNDKALYWHTAKTGKTPSAVENPTPATFCVASMGRLLPSKYAREMSVEFDSLIFYGHLEILSDKTTAIDKMSNLINKYFPHLIPEKDYRPITTTEISEIAVYKFNIDEWMGKRKKEADDFEGAFYFGQLPEVNQ